ncbi:MAG: TusE/DsrC/DsvC family sulfur relay protein [Gallionella sp.]
MIYPGTWNEDVAKGFVLQANIQLAKDHWDALNFMRQYYSEHKVAPVARHVMPWILNSQQRSCRAGSRISITCACS